MTKPITDYNQILRETIEQQHNTIQQQADELAESNTTKKWWKDECARLQEMVKTATHELAKVKADRDRYLDLHVNQTIAIDKQNNDLATANQLIQDAKKVIESFDDDLPSSGHEKCPACEWLRKVEEFNK